MCQLAACRGERAQPPQPTAAQAPRPALDPAAPAPALQASMRAFTQALGAQDHAGILRAFSSTHPWNAINTRSPVHLPTAVTHARLAQALDTPGALHDSLLGAQSGSLRSFASESWQAHGPFQFAPESAAPGVVWVAWRQEGDAWVIDTLAWPIN